VWRATDRLQFLSRFVRDGGWLTAASLLCLMLSSEVSAQAGQGQTDDASLPRVDLEVRGRVVLAESLAPVEGAVVVVADSASGRVDRALTSNQGRFSVTLRDLPGDEVRVLAIGAAADGFGRAGPVRITSEADLRRVTLVLQGKDAILIPNLDEGPEGVEVGDASPGPRLVRGRVRDHASLRTVPSARVVLTDLATGTEVTVLTDEQGDFSIDPPSWEGDVSIAVSALGYAAAPAHRFELEGEPVFVSVTIRAEALDLPGLEVTVQRNEPILERWGVLDRRSRGFGKVVMGEELEQASRFAMGRASAIFWRIPGTVVRQGEPTFLRATRPNPSTECERPDLFVNGALARSGMRSIVNVTFDDAVSVHPENIVAIETYDHPSTVPGDFRDRASACGAILIWTR
jgi:hypothetical protein